MYADCDTTPDSIKENVKKSLSKLQSPPDLLLIHSPHVPEKGKIGEFWTILEGLVEDGTLKGTSLGVSNFRPQDLEDVLKVAKIKPVVNRMSTSLSPQLSNLKTMTLADW
jgi:diketogulonate reductase-like aldo/keto reductase